MTELPGTPPQGWGYPGITSVSCATPGNCAAFGVNGFANEVNGVWGVQQGIPGLTAIGAESGWYNVYVSCPAAGDCVAAGTAYARNRGGCPAVHRDSIRDRDDQVRQDGRVRHRPEAAKGSCELTARQFKVGTYALTASYPGSASDAERNAAPDR
jgi:hypothetical protein